MTGLIGSKCAVAVVFLNRAYKALSKTSMIHHLIYTSALLIGSASIACAKTQGRTTLSWYGDGCKILGDPLTGLGPSDGEYPCEDTDSNPQCTGRPANSRYYVAVNHAEVNHCGSIVEFSYKGNKVQGKIVDQCDTQGRIDVSPWIMKDLLGIKGNDASDVYSVGLLYDVEWSIVKAKPQSPEKYKTHRHKHNHKGSP